MIRASSAVLTPPLLRCYALCGTAQIAFVGLNTVLPFHLVAMGGSRTQVGLVFSATMAVAMLLRPVAGGWVDRSSARRVLLLGIAMLAVVPPAVHVLRVPAAVIVVVMGGIGVANALINTTNSVLAARAMDAAHRGEALSLYYLASSLGIAVASPAALVVLAWGGAGVAFASVTALALLLLALALAIPHPLVVARPGARRSFRVFSRGVGAVSAALTLATVGQSALYAFVPLYAISYGYRGTIVWFFGVYSASLIGCRALFGALSDRVGRVRVAVCAMVLIASGHLTLTAPPSRASLVIAAMLLGSGSALVFPTLAGLVLDRTAESDHGVALGSVRSAWDLGIVLGSPMVGFIVDRVSFAAGFAVAGAAAALGALVFMASERRP